MIWIKIINHVKIKRFSIKIESHENGLKSWIKSYIIWIARNLWDTALDFWNQVELFGLNLTFIEKRGLSLWAGVSPFGSGLTKMHTRKRFLGLCLLLDVTWLYDVIDLCLVNFQSNHIPICVSPISHIGSLLEKSMKNLILIFSLLALLLKDFSFFFWSAKDYKEDIVESVRCNGKFFF